jgi:hypothetical protein
MYHQLITLSRNKIDEPDSRFPHFSFVMDGRRKIISYGVNHSFKSHPIAKRYGHRFFAVHSELDAILRFPYPPKYLHQYTMVNIRLGKKGEPRLARPCKSCQQMLAAFGLRRIYYTNTNGEFECIKV